MTRLDWIILAVVAGAALLGLWQGLTLSVLSAVGVIAGALLGARLAPHLLSDGSESPYTPLVALLGAVGMAIVLELVASSVGIAIKQRLRASPLRLVDAVGGLAFGVLIGLAVVWILAAVALQLPGQVELRRDVQRSSVVRELNELVPPRRVLRALARVDPFPSITGPPPAVDPPDPRVARDPEVRASLRSVVRVLGTACGLGISGSGWVAGPNLVVTNAHVVAGQKDTTADGLAAVALVFDPRNDVAILRVDGLNRRPLVQDDAGEGTPVAIAGYPENGPLTAAPGRVGGTATVISQDAYGSGPVSRRITSFRGRVRRGNSGGPLLDGAGRVVGTVFASRTGSEAGYAVPPDIVGDALSRARRPVSTGACAS
ncbi:MAG TPA: MarP family serine protease [Gaiellaceae bacterium]|nr:MarP family serine protease [Gaiellaceae bacterium]